jgi:hypothetical protein
MQCRIFSVPLDSPNPQAALDHQRNLNDFLGSIQVKQVFASLADRPQGPVWSVLFFYDDDESLAGQEGKTEQKPSARRAVPASTTRQGNPAGNPSGSRLSGRPTEPSAAAAPEDEFDAGHHDTHGATPDFRRNEAASHVKQAGPELSRAQVKSIVALKKWRAEQADREGVPVYMVAQNKWLEDIVQMPGNTLDDLKKVRGLGTWRVQKYGNKILEVLNAARTATRSWPAASYPEGRT